MKQVGRHEALCWCAAHSRLLACIPRNWTLLLCYPSSQATSPGNHFPSRPHLMMGTACSARRSASAEGRTPRSTNASIVGMSRATQQARSTERQEEGGAGHIRQVGKSSHRLQAILNHATPARQCHARQAGAATGRTNRCAMLQPDVRPQSSHLP